MGKRMFYINLVLLLMVLFVDQAFCGITDAQEVEQILKERGA